MEAVFLWVPFIKCKMMMPDYSIHKRMHQKYATDLGHCVCSIILKTTFVKKIIHHRLLALK